MLEKFFESADSISAPPHGFTLLFNSYFQKLFNKDEYFLIRFTLSHLSDFLKGCRELTNILNMSEIPILLQKDLLILKEELKHHLAEPIINVSNNTGYAELATLNYKARREMKNMFIRLINIYSKLDALQAMARATKEYNWEFPDIRPAFPVCFQTEDLTHPLLPKPIGYQLSFNDNCKFLVLTGANMSGKTTFMRSLGVAAFMAHIGMGVAAKKLKISFLQGIITNMHIQDNILKGESYFFAEVQRMKQTAKKLLQHEPHLVLMDELFKGTNVHDAYECTKVVIEGLLYHPDHLMILSTHLYEVAQQFIDNESIQFSYFTTLLNEDDSYRFTYKIQKGISNDRIGYRILQKEGIIQLLKGKDKDI